MVKNALKMSKWFSVLLALSLITISSCDRITIFEQNEYGREVPAPATIEAIAGSNLTLNCLYEPSDFYLDHKLIWGRRTKDLRFKNESDLIMLAKEHNPHLYYLLNYQWVHQFKSSRTQHFTPVKVSDRGAHFCGSIKNMLFKIIHIRVKENDDNHIQSNTTSAPICNKDQFRCVNTGTCINLHYKCDGKSDCDDGSDEDWGLCNGDPCEGKIQCKDGRCIPTSWCCNKHTDDNCTATIRPSCCPPLPDRGNHLTIVNGNGYGTPVPAPTTIEAIAGSNLSITCILEPNFLIDRELIWGHRTKDLRFKNETDLLTLAKEHNPHIYDLLKHLEIYQFEDRRTLSFTPIKLSDRGAHFCGSLKYMLFKIIHIKVKENDNYEISVPICNKDKFRCVSTGTCINLHYKCDGKSDCYDGSDENWGLCNGDPCEGKIQCRDGRCIPTTWCCNKYSDDNCTVIIRPSCCPPLPDPYDPIHYYNNQNNEKEVAKSSGPRYLFITICVVSALLSFVLFLFIISKVCGFDTKPNRSRNNNSTRNPTTTTFSNTNRCEHSECAIRREFNPDSTCLYRDNNNEVADPLIIFNNLASRGNSPIEHSDHPPPYAEVVASAPVIDKLTLDDLFNAPPPPYSSTKSFHETETGNGNNVVRASDFVNNTTSNNYCNNQSLRCDIGNTGDSNSNQ